MFSSHSFVCSRRTFFAFSPLHTAPPQTNANTVTCILELILMWAPLCCLFVAAAFFAAAFFAAARVPLVFFCFCFCFDVC